MNTKSALRNAVLALGVLIGTAADPFGHAVAEQNAAEPTTAELLRRIEALEKALAEVREREAAHATTACEAAPASGAGKPGATKPGIVAVRKKAATEVEVSGPTRPAGAGDAEAGEAGDAQSLPRAVEAKVGKPTAGYKDGFFVRSADGEYKLKIGGYVQADNRSFIDSSQDNEFVIRRARLRLSGDIGKRYDFQLLADFVDDGASVENAFVDINFARWFELRAGKFKTPFGIERLQGAVDIPFVERALTNNLVPNRDVGVSMSGEVADGRVEYALAVLNGEPDNESGNGDANDAVDVVGRIYAKPFSTQMYSFARGLGFGVAASYGRQQGTSSNEQLPSYETSGRSTFFAYTEDGDDAVADGDRYRVSPQASFYEGSLGLLAEYVLSSQQVSRDDIRAWVDNDAWQIRASYVLTGEKASMEGFEPDGPFNFGGGHWGAWQLALRWASLDVDGDAFDKGFADPTESARRADALATAINWYLNRNVAVYLHYEHTMFGGGDGTGDRDDENVFLTRLQVAF